jgi:hypothetical protein
MARTQRDEVEDKVRMRLQEILNAAGVPHGRIALEVLYWMPQEFVREYYELYMRAVHLGDGDDGEKAGEDQGRIKAKVKSSARGGKKSMEAREGKRYKVEWVIKDERALKLKTRVDGKLVELLRKARHELMEADQGKGNLVEAEGRSHGSTPGVENGRGLVLAGGKKHCRTCGKIAANDWVMCPRLHA